MTEVRGLKLALEMILKTKSVSGHALAWRCGLSGIMAALGPGSPWAVEGCSFFLKNNQERQEGKNL